MASCRRWRLAAGQRLGDRLGVVAERRVVTVDDPGEPLGDLARARREVRVDQPARLGARRGRRGRSVFADESIDRHDEHSKPRRREPRAVRGRRPLWIHQTPGRDACGRERQRPRTCAASCGSGASGLEPADLVAAEPALSQLSYSPMRRNMVARSKSSARFVGCRWLLRAGAVRRWMYVRPEARAIGIRKHRSNSAAIQKRGHRSRSCCTS